MIRPLPILAALGWMLLAPHATAAPTARVRLDCLSLRFEAAKTDLLGQEFKLELGTSLGADSPNGEVAPTFDDAAPSHVTLYRLHNPLLGDPISGTLLVDVPMDVDVNNNGFADFFEVAQTVGGTTTSGAYRSAIDEGTVGARWSREAGSDFGTCKLKLVSNTFGELPEFTTRFQVLEYTGTLEYTPAALGVTGSVKLTQTTTEPKPDSFAGPVNFAKSSVNRLNELLLINGAWTDSLRDTLTFTNTVVFRDTALRTNYFGRFLFLDGFLDTSEEDFTFWQLSIDDLNDTNNNGVPDLSDDPPPAPSTPPRLRLLRENNRLQLEITADAGASCDIEQTPTLSPITWTKVQSVKLTAATQTVELPIPPEMIFVRVKRP